MRLALIVALTFGLAGCGSAEKHEESVPAPTAAHIAETERSEAAQKTASSSPSITGFGALDAAWNEAHTEDTNYNHEAAYNPTSSLPDGYKDEYGDVTHTNGRVTGYEYHFASESAKEAQSAVLREQFPADARAFHYEVLNTCAIMLIRSATLTQALGLSAGTPVAQISLEASPTESAEEQPFDPSSVDTAIVSGGYSGIEKITGGKC
jgi:hypothetical protein